MEPSGEGGGFFNRLGRLFKRGSKQQTGGVERPASQVTPAPEQAKFDPNETVSLKVGPGGKITDIKTGPEARLGSTATRELNEVAEHLQNQPKPEVPAPGVLPEKDQVRRIDLPVSTEGGSPGSEDPTE